MNRELARPRVYVLTSPAGPSSPRALCARPTGKGCPPPSPARYIAEGRGFKGARAARFSLTFAPLLFLSRSLARGPIERDASCLACSDARFDGFAVFFFFFEGFFFYFIWGEKERERGKVGVIFAPKALIVNFLVAIGRRWRCFFKMESELFIESRGKENKWRVFVLKKFCLHFLFTCAIFF